MIVFLKHFDRTRQTLLGAGTVFVQETDKVRELEDMINDKMGWEEGTALNLYDASFQNQSLPLTAKLIRLFKEITPRVIKPMNPKLTMFENDFGRGGDIICFQKIECVSLESSCVFPFSNYPCE
jgi:ubiquitin carboxyl-terminal hydrolase 7